MNRRRRGSKRGRGLFKKSLLQKIKRNLRGGNRRRRVINRGGGILSNIANKLSPYATADNAIRAIRFASNVMNGDGERSSQPMEGRRRRRRRRRQRGGIFPLALAGPIIGKAIAPALAGILFKKILKV